MVEPYEKDGKYYIFKHWALGDFKGDQTEDVFKDENFVPTHSMTLVAVFNVSDIYKITYELNGGTNNKDNPATSHDFIKEDIVLKAPTHADKEFKGWYDNASLTGTVYTTIPGEQVNDIFLYAKWSSPIEYSITYELDGGTWTAEVGPSSYTTESGTTIPSLNNKQVDGVTYYFTGWYYDSNFSNLVGTNLDGETGDKILYAKFADQV